MPGMVKEKGAFMSACQSFSFYKKALFTYNSIFDTARKRISFVFLITLMRIRKGGVGIHVSCLSF